MSTRRRKKSRDHRRGKSVEDISKEELVVIFDEDEADQLGGIEEDCDMDEYNNNSVPNLQLNNISAETAETPTSTDMTQLLDEIDSELTSQYPTPPHGPHVQFGLVQSSTSPANISSSIPSSNTKMRMKRSDSHYAASTPLHVKKYTNIQLDSLIKSKKPRLANAHNELPLLTDIKDENERIDILLTKLSLCEVLCDFRIVTDIDDINDIKIKDEMQCIANKKVFLKECTKYLTKSKWSSIFILQQIFRTVQTNLFRSLPDSFILEEFRGIDQPKKYTLPSWKHLQFIYELMFQVLMNKDIDQKTISSYLSGSFLNNFVQLFHSLCKAEVDYVKILIHSMYLDFVSLRDEIRISLSQYCWDFIYNENGTSDGINAILDIMNSILQGLDDDKLNDPTKWYLVLCHVLCPLHKGKNFSKFEQTLYKCIKTFIKSNPQYFVVIFNYGLLRFWPKTNPSKEYMFVKEIMNVLKMVKRQKILCNDNFTNIFNCVIKQMRRNLLSKHYQIVNETIESIKEKLMRQCIEFHAGENGWKQIYKTLIYVTYNHYLYLTRDSSKQMLDWLKKYRITKKHIKIFESLENEYTMEHINTTEKKNKENNKLLRQKKWQRIIAEANDAKNKLLKEKQQQQQQKRNRVNSKEKEKEQEQELANIYETSFQYPSSYNDSNNNSELHSKLSIPSLHRISNSQPMPEPETPSKPIHKKRASQAENNYGYPNVHSVYNKYLQTKSENCRNPTHLVLFAKKNGIEGITFAITNKYFNARKASTMTNHMHKQQKTVPLKPHAIITDNNNIHRHINKYRRKKSNHSKSITSPIIKAIKHDQKIDQEISKEIGLQMQSNQNDNYNTGKIEYNGHKRDRSNDSPYWSALHIDSKELELETNILKMAEINEEETVTANFYDYTKEINVHAKVNVNSTGGSSTPATPGSIKASPMTPTSAYWSAINKDTYNLNSLVANNISLK